MPITRTLAIALMLSAFPAISSAQKPKNSGKATSSRLAGKGTPANLSHHRDNSALVLRENTHNGPAADLNRIEQQSLHSQVATSKQTRIRPVGAPKLGVAKVDKNVPINFSGRAPAHTLTSTRSTGKSTGALPAKPH
jgi:hypothetical protein